MKPYREMSKEELASLKEQLTAVYKEYQGKNLSLNTVSYTHLTGWYGAWPLPSSSAPSPVGAP